MRKFVNRDLPKVLRIEKEAFESPWPGSAFLYLVKSGWGARGEIQVLEQITPEGLTNLVGYVCLMWEKGLGHILNLAVEENLRGKRLGERLLLAAIDRFTQKKMTKAVLEVRLSNEVARKLYEKHGFVEHHVEAGYYSDGEDALVMTKTLRSK